MGPENLQFQQVRGDADAAGLELPLENHRFRVMPLTCMHAQGYQFHTLNSKNAVPAKSIKAKVPFQAH